MGWSILAFILGFGAALLFLALASGADVEDRRRLAWIWIAGVVLLVFFGGLYFEAAAAAAAYGAGSGTLVGLMGRWIQRYRQRIRR
jgi:hypothetical protein